MKKNFIEDYLTHLHEGEVPFETGYDEDAPDEFGEDYNDGDGQPDEGFIDGKCDCEEPCEECSCGKMDEQTSCAAGIGGFESMGNSEKERSGIKKSKPIEPIIIGD